MKASAISAPLPREGLPIRVSFGTAEVCAFILCVALLIASPVLAFESHVVNVRMSLAAPVSVAGGEFVLAADGVDQGSFAAELTPSFIGQTRLTGLRYRVVASVEPADGSEAAGTPPAVVLVRDPAEDDVAADVGDQARLGTVPDDPVDRWLVRLEPAPIALAPAPVPAALPEEPPSVGASLGTSDTPVAAAPAAERPPVTRWLVRVRVEITGYDPASEAQ